jgi:cell division protein FtsA
MSHAILTKNQKEVGCVLVNIGASTVSVVVFEEGHPISLEVFPLGSDYITNDIALGLQVPLDEAEKIKIDYTDGSTNGNNKRKLSDIIEARLNDIFEVVESHLKKINREETLPGGIVLTGGGSNLFNLEEAAKSCLRLPARIGTFALKKDYSAKNITAQTTVMKDQVLNDPSWSTALGLCLMNANESSGDYADDDRKKNGIIKNIKKWLGSLLP